MHTGRWSVMALSALLLAGPAMAAEMTPMEKLCAGYEKKKLMLEKRLKRGTREWERPRIQQQLDQIATDSAKHCGKPVPPPAAKP